MSVLDALDRPIAYHRVFAALTGSVKAAVLLSQAVYWQKRAKQADGWWYKTADEWTEETGLSKREQDTARKDCEKYLKTELRGIPATLYWRVDEDALEAALSGGKREASFDESAKLVSTHTRNINKEPETTAENMVVLTEKEKEQAGQKVMAMVEQARHGANMWRGRELFRDNHLDYADWYNHATGQEPGKKFAKSWQKAFSDWEECRLTVDSLKTAFAARSKWRTVADPNELTKDAAAIQAMPAASITETRPEWRRYVEPEKDAVIYTGPRPRIGGGSQETGDAD